MDEFVWRPLRTIREELKENCGKMVKVFLCCCNKTLIYEGTVTEIGEDYCELKVECSQNIQASTTIAFPLNRVEGFIEVPFCREHKAARCNKHWRFRVKLDKFRGHLITATWCICNEARINSGLLGEIEADFLELRNYDNTGADLIIKYSNLCAVEKPCHHLKINCPSLQLEKDHIPYIK